MTKHSSSSKMFKMKMKMVMGSHYIPKSNPNKPLGEDAHFLCPEEQTIGVADGVGGYARLGIDSGVYARQLMRGCKLEAERLFQKAGVVDPFKVLEKSHSLNYCEGASTALIATFNEDHHLRAVNVGDSGFLVIRGGTTVYHTPVQQLGFNCPRQMSKPKPEEDGFLLQGQDWGQEVDVEMEPGDMIVFGTDGLFDNLFDSEIEMVVEDCLEGGDSLDDMAKTICVMAELSSKQKMKITPFTKAASAAGLRRPGGKYDDITVIAAAIAMVPCILDECCYDSA